jgi:flagellar hook-basal body complex protein FliE
MIINRIDSGSAINTQKPSDKQGGLPFGEYLKNALDSANEAQIKANEETTKVLTGESEDLHQALIAAEEARLQMELVVQVRNKLVESYQEISRMQI